MTMHALECPDCGQPTLTEYQKAHGYHCDNCTREADPIGYYNEVMGHNDYEPDYPDYDYEPDTY